MKTFSTVSATQIELFRRCPRLWVDRYIFGNKIEATPEMLEGSEIHQITETLLKAKRLTVPKGKWQKVVERLIAYFQVTGLLAGDSFWEGVSSEVPIRIKTAFDDRPGPWINGAVDVLDVRLETPSSLPTIYDIKSKKKLDLNYLLNSYQLENDIQLSIYARWVMHKYGTDKVKLIHVYLLRDPEYPEVKEVPTVVGLSEVEEAWNKILDTIHEMDRIYRATPKTLLDVSGNNQACFQFGKACHNLDTCEPQSPLVGLRVTKKETNMEVSNNEQTEDLAELLRKKKAAKSAPAAAAPVSAPPMAVATPVASILPPNVPGLTAPAEPAPPVVEATPEVVAEAPAKAKKTKKVTAPVVATAEGTPSATVYVGCAPLGRVVQFFRDWLAPIESELAAQNKVAHWGMIEYHANAIMASAIKARLSTLPPELVLHGNEPAAGIFLSVLPSTVNVVRGF
jgi:hypothetical protein